MLNSIAVDVAHTQHLADYIELAVYTQWIPTVHLNQTSDRATV